MTENKNNQNTVDQEDPNKIKLTARGKKVAAVALTGLAIAGGVVGDKVLGGGTTSASASSEPKQEQTDPRYTVQEGDTVEEIAKDSIEDISADQPFAEEPTEGELDTKEMEIVDASNDAALVEGRTDDIITNPDEIKPGQELVIPDASEVSINVTPESDQRPTAGPQN